MTEEQHETAHQKARDLAALLSKHGVPIGEEIPGSGDIEGLRPVVVGVQWCPYGYEFHCTLPEIFKPILQKLREVFNGYEVRESTWSHLGDAGSKFLHFRAGID